MQHRLPPPADEMVVKLELIRIKMILENPDKLQFLGNRKKNIDTLAKLGINLAGCIAYINELTYRNYLSGPLDDRDTHDEKCVWEFGTVINDLDVYIKIKHVEEDGLLLLSFHESEKPFVFYYE